MVLTAAVVLVFGATAYTQGRAGGAGRGGQAPARAQAPWPPKLEARVIPAAAQRNDIGLFTAVMRRVDVDQHLARE